MFLRVLLGFLLVLVMIAGLFIAFAWRTEIAPIEPPARASFDPGLIARGASLAAIGDCTTCHTAPEGTPYAGGFPLHTQFGTIYGTNITPEPDTGIGRWSQIAFTRAMREGVDRAGRHLYPAFPYEHFVLLGDDDIAALYAFLMTREPVRAQPPRNQLAFPLNMRILLAGWKALYLDRTEFRADPAQNADWNRGAYLAHTLAHCGACHTPRNVLGATQKRLDFSGGEVEGWHAPPINAASRAPIPWTADSLFRYLRYGVDELHEVAAGPMAPVVHNLSAASESDVRAIALYIASVIGPPDVERQTRAQRILAAARASSESPGDEVLGQQRQSGSTADLRIQTGALIYAGTCALCHGSTERAPGSSSASALHLALSTSVSLPTSGNLIRIIMQGLAPPDGEAGPFMPGFASELTDDQIAALVSYLRASLSDRPEWPHVAREVRKARNDHTRR
jgi:mono/diheme cytochrome c family protein